MKQPFIIGTLATTFNDASGRVVGKARTSEDGSTIYDAAGRVTGKARPR